MIVLNQIVLLPFLVYVAAILVLLIGMIGLSYFLGERHKEKLTDEPYESGIPPTGDARLRFSSHFYLIAMFFVIFDLDAAFVFAWAISFRELGTAGFIGIVIFIGILMVVLLYELGIGALDFGAKGKRILKQKNKLEK